MGVSEDVRDDAGWTRINTLNQVVRQDVGGDTWSFSYDQNGNMTRKINGVDTWTYTWDTVENRLLRVQGPGSIDVNYSFDMAVRMLTRDDGAVTTFMWDGFDCIREQTGMSTTTYCIPEGQLTSFIRDGDRFDVHTDALASVRLVTDDNGDVVLRGDFDAWGGELAGNFDNVPGGMPYGFVGSLGVRFDSATGLHYMRQRWYDATLQRFISRDPIGLAGGINLYAYCLNNPINNIDPSGLETLKDGLKAECYWLKIQEALDLLHDFLDENNLWASLGKYYDAAKRARYGWDDSTIQNNPDAAAHTMVSLFGDRPKIVFNSTFLADDSSYFLATTLLHEGVHAEKGFYSSNLVPFYKEWEPSYFANDDLKAGLAGFETKWRKKRDKRKLQLLKEKCKCLE